MTKGNTSIFERKVLHPGKPFIKADEENARAYVVQSGEVRSYVIEEDGRETDIETFGPGRIVGEISLMSDEPLGINYEAVENTQVIMVTRAEFQKKISKIDDNIATILQHITDKLNAQSLRNIDEARERSRIHPKTSEAFEKLVTGLSENERDKYIRNVLPHMNEMIKAIVDIKDSE